MLKYPACKHFVRCLYRRIGRPFHCRVLNNKIFVRPISNSPLFHNFKREFELHHGLMENLQSYEELLTTKIQESFYRQSFLVAEETSDGKIDAWVEFIKLSMKTEMGEMDLERDFSLNACINLCLNLNSLTNERLIWTLCGLSKWLPRQSTRTPVFKKLWNGLDGECTRRIAALDKKDAFAIADLWYSMKLSRISRYNKAFIEHYVKRIDELERHEFVMLLFFVGVQRECETEWLWLLEKRLLQSIDDFVIDELSIASTAIFKTGQVMEPNIVLKIIDRMKSELVVLKNINVSSLAKILHRRNPPLLEPPIMSLLDASCEHVKNWDSYSCIHMLMIMPTMALDHDDFIHAVIERFASTLPELRLKDLSKLLFCLSFFNHQDRRARGVYSLIVDELGSDRRKEEAETFPHAYVTCLLCLAYQDMYPKDLLEHVLTPDFYNRLEKRTKLDWWNDMYKLDSSVRIERPQYTVLPNDLREELRKEAIRTATTPLHATTYWHRMFSEVKDMVVSNLPHPDYACVQNVLDHFPYSGLIMHKIGNRLLPIKDGRKDFTSPLQIDERWFYFYVGGRGCYSANKRLLLGMNAAYIRQLRILNFTIIEIPWFEFQTISKLKRYNYVKKKLRNLHS